MEKQLENCREKAIELVSELEGIFGKEVMVKLWAYLEGLFGRFESDYKSFREYCSKASKLLEDLSISDAKVSHYRDILKKDFDDCTRLPMQSYFITDLSVRSIFPDKMVDDLGKFVNVCKGFIVDEDAKAQSFHNELIKACNEFTRNTVKDDNKNLQAELRRLCDKLVKIIKSRKKSSIITKLTSKSSSYLKNIVKNAENLDKSIISNEPEEKYFDALVESIKKTIDAGKKMKQRRKEHYPILSYPDVQEAFNKIIKIVNETKEKLFDTKA